MAALTYFSIMEVEMFKALGFGTFANNGAEPIVLYRMAIEYCFLNGLQGGAVEALRRAARVFLAPLVCCRRMTPEFDALVYGLDDPPLNKDISIDG